MTCFGGILVANAGSDNVSAYGVDPTGALSSWPGFPVAVGKSPTSIVVDPDNGFVFVANHGGSNDISAFSFFDQTPVPGSPYPVGGNPLSLALAPSAGGHFLYSANPDATNPSISGFSIDLTSGALSPLSGSPFPIPVSHYIAIWDRGAPPSTCMSRQVQASSAMPSTRPVRLLHYRDSRSPSARMPTRYPSIRKTRFSMSPVRAPRVLAASEWTPRPAH